MVPNSNLKKNSEGYTDITAYKAIKNTDADAAKFHKVLNAIFTICELAGFHVEGRIVLKDKETGRVWR